MFPLVATAGCQTSDADVKVSRWYDEQGMNMYFSVVGELVNNCNEAIGIQVRFVGRDKGGNLVEVNESWPASIRNIPAKSRSPFKTTAFPYNKTIKTLSAEVVSVHRW